MPRLSTATVGTAARPVRSSSAASDRCPAYRPRRSVRAARPVRSSSAASDRCPACRPRRPCAHPAAILRGFRARRGRRPMRRLSTATVGTGRRAALPLLERGQRPMPFVDRDVGAHTQPGRCALHRARRGQRPMRRLSTTSVGTGRPAVALIERGQRPMRRLSTATSVRTCSRVAARFTELDAASDRRPVC
jgi:hypothetical protein